MLVNFLSLLPSTLVTVLVITIAFLRFYDQTDFQILGFIADPRIWSNRFTVAAIMATVANFGVEWYRRNRETNRLAEEKQRTDEERERREEEEARRMAQELEERERRIDRERREKQRRDEEDARRIDRERREKQRRDEEDARRIDRELEEEARRMAQELEEKGRRIYRELKERERTTRRARIETRCRLAQIRYQLEPNEIQRQELSNIIAILEEYGETF